MTISRKIEIGAALASAVAAAFVLTACGTSTPQHAPQPSRTATATAAAAPAGCDQAPLVMSAVRTQIGNGQITAAASQLRQFARSLPSGQLQTDVYAALLHLDRVRVDSLTGQSVGRDARAFARSFLAVTTYCAS